MSNIPNITLSNGVEMPQLAVGTAPLIAQVDSAIPSNPNFRGFLPERMCRSLSLALDAGIRHIDTAVAYRSHRHIASILGSRFASGKLRREDVFITSKVYHPPNDGFGTADTLVPMNDMTPQEVGDIVTRHFERALDDLGVGYVDLMLLHWPAAWHCQSDLNPSRRLAAWKVLEHMLDKGWTRSIGVSNFSEVHLERLMSDGARIRPHVNQIEASVYLQREGIIEYCRDHGIIVEAYSPLGRGVNNLLEDPLVQSIAKKHGRDEGQISLRYLIQKGFAVAFLSSSAERLKTNQDVFSFELDDDDMERLSALKKDDKDGSWGPLCSPYEMS